MIRRRARRRGTIGTCAESEVASAGGSSRPLRPPDGVYVMEGEGSEAISFPPVSQEDGETMPATVLTGFGIGFYRLSKKPHGSVELNEIDASR